MHWLTGPILTKELRVASRRRRVYVLRLVYLAVMAMILVPLWSGVMDRGYYDAYDGTAASMVYRMADLGRTIVPAIVWIQFIAVQLVAMLTMSTSVSDEIARRTLGTLLTTPMNAWQLVIGKLASRLVQCVSLLAMSLPVLALLTVFGGVEWSFVLIGLALTLSTMLIVSSVTMYFSIHNSRPYLVFLESLLALGILLGGSVLVAHLIYLSTVFTLDAYRLLSAVHPVVSLLDEHAGGLGSWTAAPWWVCVISNVAFSALVLWRCVRVVRRASLASAMGISLSELRQQDKSARRATEESTIAPVAMPAPAAAESALPFGAVEGSRRQESSTAPNGRANATPPPIPPTVAESGKPPPDSLKSLHGNPVYWKDSIRRRFRTRSDIAAAIVFGVQAVSYLATISHLDSGGMSAAYLFLLGVVGALIAVVVSATAIPGEREARTWDMVLASPMGNNTIVWGKFLSAARRSALAWFPLGLHVLIFTIGGILHPIVAVHVAMIVAGVASFLAAMGVLVGTFARRTTVALVVLLTICLLLWLVVPLAAVVMEDMDDSNLYSSGRYGYVHYRDRVVSDVIANANPFVQLAVVGEGSTLWHYSSSDLDYDWCGGSEDVVKTTMIVFFTACGYALTAAVTLGLAGSRMRKP